MSFELINLIALILTPRIEESEADRKERLENWQKYLESEDGKKEIAEKNQQTDGSAASSETSTTEIPKIDSSESEENIATVTEPV